MNTNLNRIKAAMKVKRLTNSHIAKKAGVTTVWVSMVIHGRAKSARIKQTISECLEIPYNELWPEKAA